MTAAIPPRGASVPCVRRPDGGGWRLAPPDDPATIVGHVVELVPQAHGIDPDTGEIVPGTPVVVILFPGKPEGKKRIRTPEFATILLPPGQQVGPPRALDSHARDLAGWLSTTKAFDSRRRDAARILHGLLTRPHPISEAS